MLTQPAEAQHDAEFHNGELVLSEGSQLDGLISYKAGNEVKFQTSGLEQQFNSSEIDKFAYFEASSNRWRKFLTMGIKEKQVRPDILEILAEGKDYAFLLHRSQVVREEPINPSRHSKGQYIPRNLSRIYGTLTSIRTENTFYLLTHEKGIIPYIMFIHEDGNTNVRYLDKALLEQLAGTHLNDLLDYKDKKSVKPRTQEELIQIINNLNNLYQVLPGDGKVIKPF